LRLPCRVRRRIASRTSVGLIHSGTKHVIWDWNGTLLDDMAHCISVMNAMLQESGLDRLDSERYRALFDFPVRRYYERLGFEAHNPAWERLAARFIRDYDEGVRGCALHSGAARALEQLSARGVDNIILSAARRHSIEALLDHFGIRQWLAQVLGLSDHYAESKTHLGIQWIERSRATLGDTLLVGDTTHDYEVAQAMGIPCVLVAYGHHGRDKLSKCGCPVVDSIEELF
jgi:phosphoglycolate phosphatase